MGYYQRRNYSRKIKKTEILKPILEMKCPKHGYISGYSKVYESLNPEKDIVELKCFECLNEPYSLKKEIDTSIRDEVEKKAYRKYGRNAEILRFISGASFIIPIFGFSIFFEIFGILKTILVSGILFFFTKGASWYLKEEYYEYKRENTIPIENITDARTIVYKEEHIVAKWKEEQVRIERERVKYSFEEIDKMTGSKFEVFIKNVLQNNEFENSKVTKASGDEGVDILTFKNGKKIAIQCKRYKGKISNSAIQEVFSGMHFYNCDEAYVITNSYFTENAIILAKKLKVKLINRDELFKLMETNNENETEKDLNFQTELF